MNISQIYHRFIAIIFPRCDWCDKRKFIEFTTRLTVRDACKFCEQTHTSFSLCVKCYNYINADQDEQMNYYSYHIEKLFQKHIQEEHSSVELV